MKEWKKELVRVVRVTTTDNIFGRTSLPLCAGQRARLSVAGLLDANKNTRFPHKFTPVNCSLKLTLHQTVLE